MSTKRIVVVVQPEDLDDICEALLKIGVKAEEIFLSEKNGTTTLEKMGVDTKFPAGQLYIRDTDEFQSSGKDYPVIIIY